MNNTLTKTNAPTSILIDLSQGQMSPSTVHETRKISNLFEQFCDQMAAKKRIEQGDPVVYEIFHHGFITDNTDMAMGMSVISSGKVGNEYFMTKGHMHERPDQAEIYYCVQGSGLLLMDDLHGDFQAAAFNSGIAVHIPPQYAHRVVNVGTGSLIFVSAFHLAAGHLYEPITRSGFEKIVVEQDGKPMLLPNPKRSKTT